METKSDGSDATMSCSFSGKNHGGHCELECGTSLAEKEYEGRLHGKSNHESAPMKSVQSEDGRNLAGSAIGPSDLAAACDLKDLRERLAQTVVTQHATLTTFMSPMEDPATSDPNHHKYLELPLVYGDQTASNRPVQSIEDYLQRVCLPLYGNTHTSTSITGSQSTALVAEARQIMAEACNAKITGKAKLDVVLFAGQGATSAVQLLIDGMGIRHADKAPIVFCGPYEHHSNLIPWREAGCRLVMIPEGENGAVDLVALERRLKQYETEADCLKMGTFCAASNVTGKLTDTTAVAATLHKYGALAFFDYATAAPYISMDMNPPSPSSENDPIVSSKDAMFISPHKCFGGGAGTPGVLVCKQHLLSQVNPPGRSGGGTVFYVTHSDHRFLSNRLERYEGGTPQVVGIWRTGLVMRLKQQVELAYTRLAKSSTDTDLEPRTLVEYECHTYRVVADYWNEHAPNLVLLGDDENAHLPIFSFLIRCGERFLHYNYVCAVLNDVFGIQSRGGCQCAGPYSQRLLGLTTVSDDDEVPSTINRRLEQALVQYKERAELLRPGYTRMSLPFKGLRQAEADYIMRAVVWVAKHGWALMCQYRCNHRTGEWRHCNRQGKPLGRVERRWLSHFLSPSDPIPRNTDDPVGMKAMLDQTMVNADLVLEAARIDQKNIKQTLKMTSAAEVLDDLEDLRWYVYPQECAQMLASQEEPASKGPPKGALDPNRANTGEPSRSVSGLSSQSRPDVDRKRKLETKADLAQSDAPVLVDGMVQFRDVGTNGVGSLAELDNRIRSGELSDNCEIRNNDSGEWLRVRALLGSNKKYKSISPETRVTSGTEANMSHMKKEARSSASWGIGRSVATGKETAKLEKADMGEESSISAKMSKNKHKKPPAKMMRLINQAIFNWDMIENGDRLLLGLSGGKDSLSLLHCLMEFRRKMPIDFEIEVCTIDPMTPSFDPSPLIPYVESLGLKYHYISDDIVSRASKAGKDGKMVSSLCAFCARMKRGNLYTAARKNKCNKLVLAQHLDDCAESFMMSVMHNGFLRTMKAHYTINEGDLAVIRPLVYCRESLMADFSKSAGLPVINENCPACFEEPKERARVKKLLSREELNYPNFYDNIRRSLIPLMHGDLEPILHGYTDDVVSKARKRLVPQRAKQHAESDDAVAEEKKEGESSTVGSPARSLADASDEELLRELARRKAEKHRLAGAMKRLEETGEKQATSAAKAVCTIDGACSFFD